MKTTTTSFTRTPNRSSSNFPSSYKKTSYSFGNIRRWLGNVAERSQLSVYRTSWGVRSWIQPFVKKSIVQRRALSLTFNSFATDKSPTSEPAKFSLKRLPSKYCIQVMPEKTTAGLVPFEDDDPIKWYHWRSYWKRWVEFKRAEMAYETICTHSERQEFYDST